MPLTLAPAAVLAATETAPPTLANFGGDPFWLVLLKVLGVFVFLVGMTLFMIVWERKAVARMQQRKGPNRTGPQGSLQSLADGLKLALKEEIIPALADKPVYIIAPILSAVPAFMAFAVIPLGPEVSIFGNRTPLQMTDLPVGVLFVLAMASVGVYGLILAGWASGSTYPLLGSLRSAAQVISYEVALGLALVPVFLFTGSLSTSEIVAAQSRDFLWGIPFWNVILLPSFAIYVVSAVGETNRAPFDLPEAESELVGGFHTEYTSLKFAMFFLAEYINMVTVSAVAVTLFLGGWLPPWPLNQFEWASTGWVPIIWFTLKLLAMLFTFIWLRATLPRLRYDQFMKFGWKFLIPVALGWIVVVSIVRGLQVSGYDLTTRLIVVVMLVAVLWIVFELVQRARYTPPATAEETREQVRGLGTFPVPELPVGGQLVFRGPGNAPLRPGDDDTAGSITAGTRDGGSDESGGGSLPSGRGAHRASDRAGRS